jgi:hypothetical protein
MNKKILGVVTILAFSLLLAPLVIAKPGAEKSNPKFLDFVLHVEFADASDDYPSEWRLNPPSLMDDMGDPPYNLLLIPEEARVLFVKNRIWYLPQLPFPAERYVQIGTEIIDLNPSDLNDLPNSDFYCVYDVTWVYEANFGVYNLETTLTIDSAEYSGTIQISSIEKTTVEGFTMIGKGTFVGHGVINGQNVQVSGERLVEIDLTFTEPPTMEETGTIQFLGN